MKYSLLKEDIDALYEKAERIEKNQISQGLPAQYEKAIKTLQKVYSTMHKVESMQVNENGALVELLDDTSHNAYSGSALIQTILGFDETKNAVKKQLQRGGQPNPVYHANYIQSKINTVSEEVNTHFKDNDETS